MWRHVADAGPILGGTIAAAGGVLTEGQPLWTSIGVAVGIGLYVFSRLDQRRRPAEPQFCHQCGRRVKHRRWRQDEIGDTLEETEQRVEISEHLLRQIHDKVCGGTKNNGHNGSPKPPA